MPVHPSESGRLGSLDARDRGEREHANTCGPEQPMGRMANAPMNPCTSPGHFIRDKARTDEDDAAMLRRLAKYVDTLEPTDPLAGFIARMVARS